MRKVFTLTITMVICMALVFAGGSSDKTSNGKITITIGHALSEDQTGHQALLKLEELLEERSSGNIDVVIYPNSVLGSDTDIADSVINGNVTMGMPTVSSLATYAPELNVLDAPFVFSSSEEASKVLDGEVGQELLDSLSRVGLQGLSFWDNGFRYLTANTPIRTVADLKGIKIRVMENDIHLAFWKALGANPSPLAYSELYSALQQGAFDAEENTLSNILAQKFYEVQKYVIGTRHIYSPFCLYINKDFYDSLSQENKDLINQAVAECRDYQRELSTAAEESIIAEIEANGSEFIELTPEELSSFQSVVSSVYDRVSEKAGSEIAEKFFNAVEEVR